MITPSIAPTRCAFRFITLALALFVAWFGLAPLRGSPQTADEATSPKLHAWFEYEYAREATYLSLTKPHWQKVLTISQALDSGRLSVTEATTRINAVLTPDEKTSVTQIEQSFFTAWNGIYHGEGDTKSLKPLSDAMPLDPAQFVLLVFHDIR